MIKFQIGDSVLAYKGSSNTKLVGIIFKSSNVSGSDYPDRCVFSVRFQDMPANHATFVYTGSSRGYDPTIWYLPGTDLLTEASIIEVHRGTEVIWTG
jgi:hypothetical protein